MTLSMPSQPRVKLSRNQEQASPRAWDFELPSSGKWWIEGVAGSGVTSLVADIVVQKISQGADPSGILVVSPDKESGARLRREIINSFNLAEGADSYSSKETLVRSVHSLAFALLRMESDDEIRMLTGAEQDAAFRDMLTQHAHHAQTAPESQQIWPEWIRPALGYVGFARALRDFLLRAVERQQSPESLIALGTEHDRPMWVAAGHFLREYEQTMRLAGTHQYSAPELLNLVLEKDLDTLVEGRWHTVIVDDAQLLDPMSGQLLRVLVEHAELAVVAGDREQAVFGFRGANEDFFLDFGKQVASSNRISLETPRRGTDSSREITIATSAHAHLNYVADVVRRRHLIDHVAWKDIAVIVRDMAQIGRMRRALLAAGVPVAINPTDVVLAEQRIVANLLLALKAVDEGISQLTSSELDELITGPVGGADPVSLRRLLRGLRRWAPEQRAVDTLKQVLERPDGVHQELENVLTEREFAVLNRTVDVLTAGREAIAADVENEQVLWAVWDATNLSTRLQTAALRGGATGSQADRDLDAVMTLFDAFGDLAERRADYSLKTTIEYITSQELPTGVRDRRLSAPDAVSILTAHGTVGREWDTVVVAGVQEGSWPSLGETGSLFGQEDLLDLLDHDIDPDIPVSHAADRLKEERRLFNVACTRHRTKLVVTTVETDDGDDVLEPSRFIEEAARLWNVEPQTVNLEDTAAVDSVDGAGTEEVSVRLLSAPAFIGRLRAIVCSTESSEVDKKQAARQLARMAQAGVPGADPDQWWSARETAAQRERPGRTSLSPSRIESLGTCPMQAVLSDAAEEKPEDIKLPTGNLAHVYYEALGRGVDRELARAEVLEAYEEILTTPQWKRAREIAEFERILDNTERFHAKYAADGQAAGFEVSIDVEVADGIRIRGRADELQRVGDKIRILDLKTGYKMPNNDSMIDHPQLKAYQLALRHGQITESPTQNGDIIVVQGDGVPIEDATLMYAGAKTKKLGERTQVALDDEKLDEFAQQLPALLEHTRSPQLIAIKGKNCDFCSFKTSCPVQPEGQLTTND